MSTSSAKSKTAPLAVGALGVVFGDIGTSPLYALRESLKTGNSLAVDETNVLGILSLMFWSLIIVITVKYLLVVMRANNDGEGGILALAALLTGPTRFRRPLILMGLFGTALLYGDGMITPAISVLSAVEGIEIAAPAVHRLVLPIVAIILVGLFSIQYRGTELIGRFFGPVMGVWFFVLALLGVVQIVQGPAVLRALNPLWAVSFFTANGFEGYLVLGSVFLVVTGGEALYADMGHFGRAPIAAGWFGLVLPSLTLNYLGQGALLLREPAAIESPFFLLAPRWAQLPLTALATVATVIASQALISGAFSLTVQAMNLGYLPRMRVIQTSADQRGQVYVPSVNWFLLVCALGLVFAFQSSSALAAAYGVAVTLTMVITTILITSIMRHRWNWSRLQTAVVVVPFLVVDFAFFGANIFKIPAGGWFPLLVGLGGFAIFTTWHLGRQQVGERVERRALSVPTFIAALEADPPPRHSGTGVYLHRLLGAVPPALLANLRHNDSLHETVVFVSVIIDEVPHILAAQRAKVVHHPLGFHELEMHYGFMDRPNLPIDLAGLTMEELSFDREQTTYFLGKEQIEVGRAGITRSARGHLYAFLARNAGDPSIHFQLPPGRTMDIGTHVQI